MMTTVVKYKHNKKKNTAFLYETLILELTKAILKKDLAAKRGIARMIKESFSAGTELHKELKLYHALDKTEYINPNTAEKIISEVKNSHAFIDKLALSSEQASLVGKIKKNLSNEVLNNFVPNYKSLATIYQIFNSSAPIKTRVILEETVVKNMCISHDEGTTDRMVPIDNLVYKTFIKKFNQEYSTSLLKEQKLLLSSFISSFTDNGLQLKIYLNNEIKRLKSDLSDSLSCEEISSDDGMTNKTRQIISELESYKSKKPDKEMVRQVIKIQSLTHEIKEDATN